MILDTHDVRRDPVARLCRTYVLSLADMSDVYYKEEPCRTALNRVRGMGFGWSLNPYTGCAHRCTFCYVRGFERRAERPSGDRYGRSIRVKVNIADVLRGELARRSWKREQVVIGAATDPYQPAEGRYRLTRSCLIALVEAATPFGIITCGPMIVRDLDVLADAARRVDVTVNISIPTLDPDVWRRTEIATAPPRQRLAALRRLVQAGVKTGVGMAPILPGLSDDPDGMADVVRAARDAGACFLWTSMLNLRPGTREHFLESLARDWPELLPTYERLYADRAYLPSSETGQVSRMVADLRKRFGLTEAHDHQPHADLAARPTQLILAL